MGTHDPPAAFSTDGDGTVIASGEIDIYTAPKLWEALALLIEQGHRKVVLDLAGVEFMDSTGISVIVRAYKQLAPNGGTVIARSPQLQVRKVFDLTGLTGLIQLES
jgi:anti-sigma B factor antagonist